MFKRLGCWEGGAIHLRDIHNGLGWPNKVCNGLKNWLHLRFNDAKLVGRNHIARAVIHMNDLFF